MPYTDFPNGVTSFGVPMVGGLGGIPLTGRWIFADYANGSDGNPGGVEDPVQTLSQAHSLATAGNNDVVVLVGDGSTTATQRLSSTLTWSKNATHLIGMTAPTAYAQRARISTASGQTTNISPLMSVTASGCIFSNFSFFQGVGEASTDEKLIDITGQRNFFSNIHFGGMGHATGAARAGSYIIKLGNNGSENTFDTCTIGLDTIPRTAANASVVVAGASTQRNVFCNCIFPMYDKTNTTPLFLDLSASNCLNGSSMTFRDCLFQNLTGLTGSVTPAVVASLATTINGLLVMDKCTMNATKWAAATTQMVISGYPVATGFTTGLAAAAADS